MRTIYTESHVQGQSHSCFPSSIPPAAFEKDSVEGVMEKQGVAAAYWMGAIDFDEY